MNETPFFFSLGEHRLFAMLHGPDRGPARCGVVMCPALAEERLWSHRVYVGVARDLAQDGVAVLRFDFRGEGDSDLEFEEAGVATRTEDTLRAIEVLLEHQPHLPGCFVLGHRFGCAPAAIAAARLGRRALGLAAWDPIASGSAYLMQWLRSVVASELAQTGTAPTRAAMLKQLDAGQTITVDGYGISPKFYRELMELEWPRLLEVIQCPVLAIDGTSEPPFWRETRRFHSRVPVMGGRTMQWLAEQAA